MANLQDVGRNHRPRRQRHTRSPSPPESHDWDGRHEPLLDSLPYRSRNRDIQRPDGRTNAESSSRQSRRASVDMRAHDGPPPPLTRSATAPHRRGRDSLAYGDDDYLEGRSRRRSRSSSGPESLDLVDTADDMRTPRSARVNRSTPDTRRSSRSSTSRRAPSVESASSVSTQGGRRHHGPSRRRDEKEDIVVIEAPEVPDPPGRSEHRREHRRRAEKDQVVYNGSSKQKSRYVEPVEAAAVPSRQRHKHHSESRSSSRRRNSHQEYRVETNLATSHRQ